LDSRLVANVYFDGGAFKDDYIVAGFETDGYGGVVSQVAGFAGRAGRSEVEGSVEPKTPDRDGVRTAIGARGADPVIARASEPFFGVAERQIFLAGF
jgi:hypothetical protein